MTFIQIWLNYGAAPRCSYSLDIAFITRINDGAKCILIRMFQSVKLDWGSIRSKPKVNIVLDQYLERQA